jgi:hypothetical protein
VGVGDQFGIQFFGEQIGILFNGVDEPDAFEKIKGKNIGFFQKGNVAGIHHGWRCPGSFGILIVKGSA